MRYAVAADHGGFPLKAPALRELAALGHDGRDFGGTGAPDDDYPDITLSAAEAIRTGTIDRAVLICASGVGAAIAANRVPGVRAAVCHDTWSAHQGVEHDDMNVLCLGAEVVGGELALELIRAFASATFSGAERHVRRLAKVREIEQSYLQTSKEPS
jgi:ribose 5-phosphate isomerase B